MVGSSGCSFLLRHSLGVGGGVRKSSVETRGKTPKLEVLKKAPLGLPPSIALENSHHPVGGHMEDASIKPNYK